MGEGRPYAATEISEAIGLPIVGVLPYDARSAEAFSTGAAGARRLPRSPLLRSARELSAALLPGAIPPPTELTPSTATPVGATRV